ncbi:MAG TPA: Ni/Fe hydrogenase subunit alpha [Thermoanaerobaculia bacterium]|nr:Ni/Fe hydrogenase subunit alpha [Thermoanaerobaculia bacterium]
MAMLRAFPEVARKALELRSFGQRVSEVIGGRGTHPVSAVAGGLAAPLDKERHAALVRLAEQALPLAAALVDSSRDALLAKRDLLFSLPLETHYLGTVKDGALDLYDGELRLRAPDGSVFDFPEDDWGKYFEEETTSRSYAKPVYFRYPDGRRVSCRVGALARLNCADRIGTPLAQAELERFRELGGFPCHQTVMYHYARLVEMLYAAERLAEIVRDPEILSPDVRGAAQGKPRRATAHVEAPRGVLVHDYDVDGDGIVTRANLVVATQHNILAINETLGLSAARYLDRGDAELLNGIEFGIRCYDPCLSCATHRLGEMRLEVTVRRGGEVVRTARRV